MAAGHDRLVRHPSALYASGSVLFLFLPDAQGGAFFIDRDPALFSALLDYMHCGVAPIGMKDGDKALLRKEADFYGCEALAAALEPPAAPAPAPNNRKWGLSSRRGCQARDSVGCFVEVHASFQPAAG